jgi:hypothetical protein
VEYGVVASVEDVRSSTPIMLKSMASTAHCLFLRALYIEKTANTEKTATARIAKANSPYSSNKPRKTSNEMKAPTTPIRAIR